MSISHTINVSDLTDHAALHRAILEIQNSGVSYSLIQDGVEIAKVVPVAREMSAVSDELTKKRLEVLAKADTLSKEITRLWSTNETAVEAITNDRNASDRR